MIDNIEPEHLERVCSAYAVLREHADETGRVKDTTSILRFLRERCGLKPQQARETSTILIATGLIATPHAVGGGVGRRDVQITDMERITITSDELDHLVVQALTEEVILSFSGAGHPHPRKLESLTQFLSQFDENSTFAFSAETLIRLLGAMRLTQEKLEAEWKEASDLRIEKMMNAYKRKPEGIVIPTTPLLEAEISRIMREMKKST